MCKGPVRGNFPLLLSAHKIYKTSVFWKGYNLGKLSPGCWWIRAHLAVSQGGWVCPVAATGRALSVRVCMALPLTWAEWVEVGADGSSPAPGRLLSPYPATAQKAACWWRFANSSVCAFLCLHLHGARISCYHNIVPIITALHALYKHSLH